MESFVVDCTFNFIVKSSEIFFLWRLLALVDVCDAACANSLRFLVTPFGEVHLGWGVTVVADDTTTAFAHVRVERHRIADATTANVVEAGNFTIADTTFLRLRIAGLLPRFCVSACDAGPTSGNVGIVGCGTFRAEGLPEIHSSNGEIRVGF